MERSCRRCGAPRADGEAFCAECVADAGSAPGPSTPDTGADRLAVSFDDLPAASTTGPAGEAAADGGSISTGKAAGKGTRKGGSAIGSGGLGPDVLLGQKDRPRRTATSSVRTTEGGACPLGRRGGRIRIAPVRRAIMCTAGGVAPRP